MTDSTSNADPTPERPRGSAGFLVLLVLVLAPSLVLGQSLGAGGASIIGGFVALFALIASMGGPLAADLRRLGLVGPLIALCAVAPRILAELSVAAAIALTTVLIFASGLLPLRGRRYDAVALGLGMGTLFGYAMPIQGGASAAQLVVAGVVGVVVAALLRVLTGLKDPDGPVRDAVAELFDDDTPQLAAAFDTWVAGRAPRWLGTVLVAATRYQVARRVFVATSAPGDGTGEEILATRQERASAVADAVRSRSTGDAAPSEPEGPGSRAEFSSEQAREAAHGMDAALQEAEHASQERDSTRVDVPVGVRARMNAEQVRVALGSGSVQVRHALRSALAVLLALLVATRLDTGDPLLPTLLMTTFAIVQVSWKATWAKVCDRLVGLVLGGVLVVLVVLVLPSQLLLPVSIVGLGVGMWFITARPAIGTAGIIVMSVGINTELRNLQPGDVIVEYVVLTLVALLIGGVVGFLVVPAWRAPALEVRVRTAVDRVGELLATLGADDGPDPRAGLLRRLRPAQAAIAQLTPDHDRLGDDREQQLEQVRSSLQDLLVVAAFVGASGPTSSTAALREAESVLAGTHDAGAGSEDLLEEMVVVLARDVRAKVAELEPERS